MKHHTMLSIDISYLVTIEVESNGAAVFFLIESARSTNTLMHIDFRSSSSQHVDRVQYMVFEDVTTFA